MSTSETISTDKAVRTTLKLLGELLTGEAARSVGVRLWDGARWPDDRERQVTLVLNHPGALRQMFLPGTEVGLGEAYLYDDFDIEGDIEAVFAVSDELTSVIGGKLDKLRLARDLRRLPAGDRRDTRQGVKARLRGKRHSIERDRQAISHHYDVSNDFYSLWLDYRMVYSCAYFPTSDTDLDAAQERKLDYICRKLRLRPGQRLLDIGSGWGGLVMYATQHYGVQAVGITLSEPQALLANERIAQAGLADRCRVELRDYREVDEPGAYDAVASIGMFEHVGEATLSTYFTQAKRLLRPGGLLLNHGIARRAGLPATRGPSFSDAYVFPDGELVPINASLNAAESAGFEVRDVESLREHYAMTLRHWVHRLEANHDDALRFVNEPTYRVWRLFMSGSAHGFNVGRLNVYQALLAKPGLGGAADLPLTRADLYAGLPAEPPSGC
ncbi:MAG: class I SAM-dependent methyltransferase [SAR202 cluster bacterium]|nr:cyclopropane-fatty-acyl-phospholipid synthase [Chloroflexota bacterium]MQG67412.1 class I SAM-dependent methyltransferase [SAR202 cluster bacterium]